jgi:hypothetical protein
MHQRMRLDLPSSKSSGEFRLSVRDLGLLLAVVGSKLRLGVSSFVHCVGYSVHTSKHAINTSTHIYRLSSRGKIKNGGINYDCRSGKGVAKFGINLV